MFLRIFACYRWVVDLSLPDLSCLGGFGFFVLVIYSCLYYGLGFGGLVI